MAKSVKAAPKAARRKVGKSISKRTAKKAGTKTAKKATKTVAKKTVKVAPKKRQADFHQVCLSSVRNGCAVSYFWLRRAASIRSRRAFSSAFLASTSARWIVF